MKVSSTQHSLLDQTRTRVAVLCSQVSESVKYGGSVTRIIHINGLHVPFFKKIHSPRGWAECREVSKITGIHEAMSSLSPLRHDSSL